MSRILIWGTGMAQEFGCHRYWRIFLFQDIDGRWRLSPKFNEEQNWHPRVLQPSKCTVLSEQSWTLEDTPHFPEAAYVTASEKRCKRELWCFEVGLPSKWPGTSWRWVGANAPRGENIWQFLWWWSLGWITWVRSCFSGDMQAWPSWPCGPAAQVERKD